MIEPKYEKLTSFIKWAGGKEQELKHNIRDNVRGEIPAEAEIAAAG